MKFKLEQQRICAIDQNHQHIEIHRERFVFFSADDESRPPVIVGAWIAFKADQRLVHDGRDYVTVDRRQRYTPHESCTLTLI
ncbi:hypothetical protein [Aquirhabdus parva]|uniref:Uncharacterized protein n=1 Tax=Aquirhabdus parva TaxID=2283318 RepID=A0A345P9B2_9GAMM|nr:hypothetical protein [Aquirhabdus parva]AXI03871.1 hypothetical protein HYN46_14110 [Aquirhabdus parva]